MDLKVSGVNFSANSQSNSASKVTKSVQRVVEGGAHKLKTGLVGLSVLGASLVNTGCNTEQKVKDVLPPEISAPAPEVADTVKASTYVIPDYFVVDSKNKARNNIWNMAKDIVSEGGAKDVTGPQIDVKCNEILKVNGLKYPSDTCGVVKIIDGQKIFTSRQGLNHYTAEQIAKKCKPEDVLRVLETLHVVK